MGATVPLMGFGCSLATGVRETVARDDALVIITGGISATVGGITAAVTLGLLCALLSRSKDKS